MATVKTASDAVYIVASAITRENENTSGWTWFLQGLHSAIECLVLPHTNPNVENFKKSSSIPAANRGRTLERDSMVGQQGTTTQIWYHYNEYVGIVE